ncbi:MAG: LysR family transcriptional regulator [Clostridiales bacterium]|nr:LysR family transcriptional regulator [Clostridiales bacterium]
MTLQQLKYVVTTADTGTVSEAAKRLYIAQPSLTASIKELEHELGITIFHRTNKGVIVSADGEEFLGYARQIMEQTALMEERYFGAAPVKHRFCVSTQHYSFAVEAFVALLRQYGGDTYDFRIRETKTHEIIEDVCHLKSEVGVLYRNPFNAIVINKTLKDNGLLFHTLFTAKAHVFVGADNPLAQQTSATLADLAPYPRLSYEQGEQNSFYFSEEILSTLDCDKDILVSDRATLFNLLIGLNGYTICSGVINEQLNGKNIVAVPLDVDEYMEIGYITHKRTTLSPFGRHYIELLRHYTAPYESQI